MNSYGGCIKIAGLRLSSSFFFLEEELQHCSFLTSTPSPRILGLYLSIRDTTALTLTTNGERPPRPPDLKKE